MKDFWAAFKKFITRGNVVDMAVGVAVASAFTAIVTAFTKGVISPLLALLTQSADLASLKWVVREAVTTVNAEGVEEVVTAEVAILYGAILQAIIDFLLVAFVLFCVMRFAAAFMNRANKIAQNVQKALQRDGEGVDAATEAEAVAKAEAEARAAAEAAAQKARTEALEQATLDTARLLSDIRDLMEKKGA